MRSIGCLILLALLTSSAWGQPKEERRYGVLHNPELYPQDTPRRALGSVLRAIEKDRFDYILAFLLDRAYVQDQLQITASHFEQLARAQVEEEKLDKKGFDQVFIRTRIRDLAAQMNFENLIRRVKAKLTDDPEAVKELRKFYSEGVIAELGDAANIQHPEVRDLKLFLRFADQRWYVENKMQE